MRFGQEHIGALVQERYSLVTQQRARVLGPAYRALDRELQIESYVRLFVRWPDETSLQDGLQAWIDWGQLARTEPRLPWGPTPIAIGRDPRGGFLACPWIDGWPIEAEWSADREATLADVVGLLMRSLDALLQLHGAGLIHGALRPSQVIVTDQGTITILRPGLDLFVAASVRSDRDRWALTKAARAQFWAPETVAHLEGNGSFPTAAADVFGFGRIMLVALEGLPKDLGTPRDKLRAVAQRCLRARPEDRPSLDELMRSVDSSVQRHRRPPGAPGPQDPPHLAPSRRAPPTPAKVLQRRARRPVTVPPVAPPTTPPRSSTPPPAMPAAVDADVPNAGDTLQMEPIDWTPANGDAGPIEETSDPSDQTLLLDPHEREALASRPRTAESPPLNADPAVVEPRRPPPVVSDPAEQPPQARSPGHLDGPDPANRHLREWAEVESFARYGLTDLAIERAKAILHHDPTFEPARELLQQLGADAGPATPAPGKRFIKGGIPGDDDQTVLAPIEALRPRTKLPSFDIEAPSDRRDSEPTPSWADQAKDETLLGGLVDEPLVGAAESDVDARSLEGAPAEEPAHEEPHRPDEPRRAEERANDEPRRADEPPAALDENVQFTVYRPPHLLSGRWSDVLFFAHLSDRRPEAPPDQPDPVAKVQTMASAMLGEAVHDFKTGTADAQAAIPREGTLTVIPSVEDVTFNPPQASFEWNEDVHMCQFRAKSTATGRTLRGGMSVYYGPLLVGEVALALKVETQGPMAMPAANVMDTGRRYRNIFASYSRKDLDVVRSFEAFARSLGDRYLLDLLDIRSGEVWSDRLEEMIRSADIFQLFWSSNAMASTHVLDEVEYAIALRQDIRPVFWERPLPQDPARNLPPADLARFHFQFLSNVPRSMSGRVADVPGPHLIPPNQPPTAAITPDRALPPLAESPALDIDAHPSAPNDPFGVGQTRAMEALPGAKRSPPRAESPASDWGDDDEDTGEAFPVVQPPSHASFGVNGPMGTAGSSGADRVLPPRPSAVSSLQAVLIAFGLALLIVSTLMLIFFSL